MSGTSHDGIDVAVVDFVREPGTQADMVVGTVLGGKTIGYDPELRQQLVAALPPSQTTLAQVCQLDTRIGQAFAAAARDAIADFGAVELVASHGQTVFHWVDGVHTLGSLQLGQPAWIAEASGAPVVCDLRARDIAAGGQGAPLVPFLDELVLRGMAGPDGAPNQPKGALNLGGIANITVVRPGAPTIGFDTGPANALVDAVVTHLGLDANGYDTDGHLAAEGHVDDALLARLLADPYFRQAPPKSTGKEHFNLAYVASRADFTAIQPADLVATLTELTARTVADAVLTSGVASLIVAGGGFANPVLMGRLQALCPGVNIQGSQAVGLLPELKEAIAFALLGWCTWHGIAATIPSVTGATGPRVLGTITPGAQALQLPAPQAPPGGARFDMTRH